MKRFTIPALIALGLLVATTNSCVKKDPPAPTDTTNTDGVGKVKLEFSNVVGSSDLSLGNQWYKNPHGDSFKVNVFNYYISNVKLNGAKGTYTETESYHLLKQENTSSLSLDLTNVPYDTYSSVTLMIGVDSARNVSGAQTGALDPANDMFWTWSTGYIMAKLEGVSPQSTNVDNMLIFHIGGHAGLWAGQRTVTLNFPTPIKVEKDAFNHVHIAADVNGLFKSPNEIDFSMLNGVMSIGKESQMIANNYANMLSVTYSGL